MNLEEARKLARQDWPELTIDEIYQIQTIILELADEVERLRHYEQAYYDLLEQNL